MSDTPEAPLTDEQAAERFRLSTKIKEDANKHNALLQQQAEIAEELQRLRGRISAFEEELEPLQGFDESVLEESDSPALKAPEPVD